MASPHAGANVLFCNFLRMFVSSACVGLYMKTCYPDEAFFLLLPDSFSLSPVRQLRHWTFSLQVQKSPVPCFPKGRGIRSCYHLMFPKRSHAPAHGVLIIKDLGISNGCQFRHSLLTFSGYLRSRFRCAAPGCIQKKKSARLSSTGSFLCGAGHFPTCSLHRFSIIYRML